MIPLRKSTASQEVLLGPFLDDTDGKTAETALSIANTDIKLWKRGGTTEADKNSGGATHIAGGRYYAVLDATDTDTTGELIINVSVAGALPVRLVCCVFEAAVFDSLFASGAAGYQVPIWSSASATVNLSATTIKAVTDAVALPSSASINITGNITGNLSGSVGSVTGAVGSVTGNVGGSVASVTGAVGSVTGNVGGSVASVVGNVGGNVTGSVGSVVAAVTAGTVSDKTGYSLVATTGLGNQTANITGNLSGSVGSVTGAVGSVSSGVTVTTNNDKTGYSLTQAFPSNFASLVISASGVASANVTQWNGGSLPTIGTSTLTAQQVWEYSTGRTLTTTIPTAAAIADAVWDEAYAGHTSSGTFGKLMDILRKANYVTDGTVAAGQTPTTTVFRSGLTAPTGTYDHQTILFLSGTLTGESRPIDTYSQTNGTFTLAEPLTSAPAIGDEFVLLPDHVHPITAIAAGVRTELAAELALVDVAISTRLATSGYTAPDNAGIAAVKAKTDNLPAAPAAVSDIPTAVAIATEVDNTLTANHGAGSWAVGGTGSGAYTFTVTVNDGATALQNATVRLAEGVNAFTGQTNASGVVVFSLDAATYSVAITKAGYSFTPTTRVVSATSSQTWSMTQITPTVPPAATLSTGTMTAYATTGLPLAGVAVTVTQLQGTGTDGSAYDGDSFTLTSDANGVISHSGFVRGATYSIRRGLRGEAKSFVVPNAASFDLSEIVGKDA